MKARFPTLIGLAVLVLVGVRPAYRPAAMQQTPAATTAATVVATPLATGAPTSPAPTGPTSYLRAVHAASDAGTVDVYLNGQITLHTFKFGDSTPFLPVAPGSYTIDIRAAGSAVTDIPLYTGTIYLATGVSADLVALGLKAAPVTDKQAFQIGVFVTDRSPTKGRSRIEVINAAPNIGAIDVLQDNKPVLTQIAFNKAGNAPLNIDPGTVHFALTATGKPASVLVDLLNTTLAPDTITTFILTPPTTTGQAQTASTLNLTTTPLP